MVTRRCGYSAKSRIKRAREIGSLIFETPLQHDYGAGVEVRSLLSTEAMEEINARMAVTDIDPNAQVYVKFWNDDFPSSPREEHAVQRPVEELAATRDLPQFPMSVPAFSVLGTGARVGVGALPVELEAAAELVACVMLLEATVPA